VVLQHTRTTAPPDIDFAAVRDDLGVPPDFPPEVVAAAEAAARTPKLPPGDDTDLALVTVDPPGSMDLDQAVHIEQHDGGFRVHYAIADVAAFVTTRDPVDAEARRRGQTLYSPDLRTPLHPPILGEGAASLLPDQVRPAFLWTIDVDADGTTTGVDVRRSQVRSRAKLDYPGLQAVLDSGTAPASVSAFPALGQALLRQARERDAIDLALPEQEVVSGADGRWSVVFRSQLPIETWNAQVSLLTGRAAAGLMLESKIGLLRTLPPPEERAVAHLRRAAPGLGVAWPRGASPGDVVSALDGADPRHAAFIDLAADLLRGAGYTAFDGTVPAQPGHGGVGAPYAHVTAPLRRLADRFALEVCVALAAGVEVPGWARSVLPELPELMETSDHLAKQLERATVDLTEAFVLHGREGHTFDAAVADSSERSGTVVIDQPAVRARCDGAHLPLGQRIKVRLITADPTTRTVRFVPADSAS